MGIWKMIKAAFGRGTSTPLDARRLNAVDELALSASLRALPDGETGWITLSEARSSSRLPRGGSTSPEKQLDFAAEGLPAEGATLGEIGHHRGSRLAEPSGMGAGLPTVGSIDDDRPR